MTPLRNASAPVAAPGFTPPPGGHLRLMQTAQSDFLSKGGAMFLALQRKYETGELSPTYEYREFPKMLRFNPRDVEIAQPYYVGNETQSRLSTVTKTVWNEVTVDSEAEETETLAAIDRAAEIGIEIGADWTAERLRQVVAQAEHNTSQRPIRPMTAAERKAARIEALRRELAELADDDEAAAAPTSAPAPAANPLAAAQPARRPHRRVNPLPAAAEAPEAIGVDQEA